MQVEVQVLLLVVAIGLLILNGFFVLAEFAAVKIRPSRVKELIDAGNHRARAVDHVVHHLDEYLSVCQVGITFASIGLGFCAEPAVVRLVEPVVIWFGFPEGNPVGWLTAHGIAFTLSYLLVSYLHILIGELIPKSVAIRVTERAALATARPLRFFRLLFYGPLWVLNGSANILLKLLGLGGAGHSHELSEDELRILLEQSQVHNLMSFRRLLFMENVFDLGELKVRDAMRPRAQVKCFNAAHSWEQNLEIARSFRHSRYPVLQEQTSDPLGIIHLKDALLSPDSELDLSRLIRPLHSVKEDLALEVVLGDMQRKCIQAAIVRNAAGQWTGFLTLEDVLEEIVGTIKDEFEDEGQVTLAELLRPEHVHLGIEANSTGSALRLALDRMPRSALPIAKELILRAIDDRERVVETYLGKNLGMPHARLPGLQKPFVLIIRSENGIPYRGNRELAHILVVLLTPAGQPRVHQRLQTVVATMFNESDFIPDRLRTAETPKEVIEILVAGEQAALD